MSGLIISLKPNEKFLINGAVLANGSKRGQICITDDNVKVLRMSDALHPNDVNTPIRRVYYLAQLVLSCDATSEQMDPQIAEGLDNLLNVFRDTPVEDTIKNVQNAFKGGRYYSVINMLKAVLALEEGLLSRIPANVDFGHDAHAREPEAQYA